MKELLSIRDAALDLALGVRKDEVLNQADRRGATRTGSDVGAALTDSIQEMLNTAVDANGKHVDYAHLRESAAYQRYRSEFRPLLATLNLSTLTKRREQLAFWINLYNALVIDAVLSYGVRQSVTEGRSGMGFFRRAAYMIGGQRFSCEDIEHGIIRNNRGNPFVPGAQFSSADNRQLLALSPVDVRAHFGLNCASRSCPPLRVYSAARIDIELDAATRDFIHSDIAIDPAKGVVHLSRIFNWYANDFGGGSGVVDFILGYLPNDERQAWIVAQNSINLAHKEYDWRLNGK